MHGSALMFREPPVTTLIQLTYNNYNEQYTEWRNHLLYSIDPLNTADSILSALSKPTTSL